MKTFESQMKELEKILESLQKDELKLNEVSAHVAKAKKLYESCKTQLDEAKMEIINLDQGEQEEE